MFALRGCQERCITEARALYAQGRRAICLVAGVCPHAPEDTRRLTAALWLRRAGARLEREGMMTKLWAANPHEFGPGKVHIVDEKHPRKTYCGKWLEAVPGKPLNDGQATCKICLNGVVNRKEHAAQAVVWQKLEAERQRERIEEKRRWDEWYESYRLSPAWKRRSSATLKRAGGICEGCAERPAVMAHHLTYEHAGEEFLWELRAVCRECHERVHSPRRP